MLNSFLCLIGCQLAGELVRETTGLPIPGPVIGMFLLAAMLVLRTETAGLAIPSALEQTTQALITLMGLLFVPAGVGIVAEAALLREEWRPILAALLGSTVLSVLVTGLVMHWMALGSTASEAPAAPSESARSTQHE